MFGLDEKITLDKETFKALAIDTRVNILKKLDERFQLTLTDIADELDMAPSTIKEHLDKLVSVGLITQVDKGMKWKYYRLTPKGKKILNPYEKKVWIILFVSAVALFAAVYRLMSIMQQLVFSSTSAYVASDSFRESGVMLSALKETAEEATTLPVAAAYSVSLPYTELILVVVLSVIVGFCVGYLIKRKRIL